MAPIGPEPPGANLPAPYRSPWSLLAGDLVAVGADLALRRRELWRRNREGQLPCPRFWPASLAASFWPLVLVLALALLGAGLWLAARPGALPAAVPPGLIASGPASVGSPGLEPPGPGAQAPSQVQSPASPQPEGRSQSMGGIQAEGGPQAPDPGSPGSERKAPGAPPGPGASPVAGSPGSPPASGLAIGQPPQGDGALALEPPPPEPNPLESWRQRPEAAGLLLQVGGDPATSRIQLVLSDGFGQLQTREQQQHADLWLTWAQDWGYDQLELRGQDGSLLGREARVGGGMILGFSP